VSNWLNDYFPDIINDWLRMAVGALLNGKSTRLDDHGSVSEDRVYTGKPMTVQHLNKI
jgi:hypothetical protein